MFTSFTDSENSLLVNRLARVQTNIRALQLSTREDYLAQLTSQVNAVLNLDYEMQPLVTITPETPGIVGDVVTNFENLNEDAEDIADETSRLEDQASVYYNLSAASQNALRQQIREGIYQSTSNRYIEPFVNSNQISADQAELDFNAGVAMLPLVQETVLTPSIAIGANSVGSTTGSVAALSASSVTSLLIWNGALLELILTFSSPTIVNRLTLVPDNYKGYEITTFTTSPDGSLFTDVLADLGLDSIVMDATAGKYSGSTVVDFPPRSCTSIRLVLQNRVDGTTIGLRSLTLTQRSYQATGSITSNVQTAPTGSVLFVVDQEVFSPYVSITHQISSDSVHYTTVQPGLVILPGQWWYRAILSRASAPFQNNSSPVIATTADPGFSTGFTLVKSTSVPLGPTTIERTLVFENVTGAIPLRETPIPGTFQVSQGTLYLTSGQFNLDANNNLSFPSTMTSVNVTYQTSAQGAANLSALEQYYTPLLSQVQFNQR